MVSEYTFSGSLPENATTYVTRLADNELYEGLKAGKFCYVLNSRQMGKSSLRVRTMGRLRKEGIKCAAIDLSFDEVQEVKPEQWYVGLIDTLIESFDLDVDLEEFWEKRPLLSALRRFRLFIEEVLLQEIEEQIVIFIDEIDGVLRLNFPTDDFFAFIRACHNQRVDNPLYNRLTFCLLGVASPGNLIKDKQRTPFNIGQGISLSGFKLDEVSPLVAGLVSQKAEGRGQEAGVFLEVGDRRDEKKEGEVCFDKDDAGILIKEILYWTGGQPFLTQKLCNLVLNHNWEQENKDLNREEELRLMVGEVVQKKIIDNWQGQDEPEHLRTIQNRILEDETKAGYLLELYQRLWQEKELATNNSTEQSELSLFCTIISTEQSELSLSGLVVRRDGKLTIYNPIYREVFNQDWLEQKLNNLRPYAESFRAWVDSKGQDKSRLLRGKALQDALLWAEPKSLSHQDSEFLAASRELEREAEIAEKERLAELEREKKDREAAEEINLVLAEANRKAKRRIFVGGVVLGVTLLGAITTGFFSANEALQANRERDEAQEQKLIFENEAENAKSDVDKYKKETQEVQEKNNLLANQNQRFKEDYQSVIKQIGKAQQQEQILNQKVAQLDSEKQRLEIKKQELETKQANLETQVSEFEVDLKESEANLTAVEQNLETKQEALAQAEQKLEPMENYLTTVKELAELAGQLQEEGEHLYSKELLILAGASAKIENNPQLRQAIVLAGTSLAYQKKEEPNLEEAEKYITKSKQELEYLNNQNSKLEKQVRFFALQTEGNLYRKQGNKEEAIKSYTQAFDVLNSLKKKGNRKSQIAYISPPFADLKPKILSKKTVESFHRDLINLLSNTNNEQERFDCTKEPQKQTKNQKLSCRAKESLKEHYLDELNNYLANRRWEEADEQTDIAMNASAQVKDYNYWYENVTELSCPDLKAIDQLWLDYSYNNFGFSVQWVILKAMLDEQGLEIEKVREWTKEERGLFSHVMLIVCCSGLKIRNTAGILPTLQSYLPHNPTLAYLLYSRITDCNL